MSAVLVVDDQSSVCYSLQRLLEREGYCVTTETNSRNVLGLVKGSLPDLILMDVRMPEPDGIEVLRTIKSAFPDIQVIMMTAHSTTEKAIQATKLGAYDYVLKPFRNEEILALVAGALKTRELLKEVVTFSERDDAESPSHDSIIGRSQAMLSVYKQVGKVAPTTAPVLVRGESGCGKERIARAIFRHSNRADRQFLAVNCAAIPEQLLESELFGHEKGAFTGADMKRIGKFEQCQHGTLFLDEIGDMSLPLQAKLLRVLQDGTFQRLGSAETIQSDVRIITATNKDIESMVNRGLFREDLFYRINVVTIAIPPLRERREDIRDLVTYFIRHYNQVLQRDIRGITAQALKKLEQHSWPGNVRELENFIQKAMVFCSNDYLSLECCDLLSFAPRQHQTLKEQIDQLVECAFRKSAFVDMSAILEEIEKNMIVKALHVCDGNQVRAAKKLGISRNTLRKRIEA